MYINYDYLMNTVVVIGLFVGFIFLVKNSFDTYKKVVAIEKKLSEGENE